MKKQIMNYEILLKVTHDVVMSRNPEDVTFLIVESVKSGFDTKGCAVLKMHSPRP